MFLSLSGVMAPGPITAVTVAHGSKSPHAGAWIAVGHGIVEFPLMILIFLGFEYLLKSNEIRGAIGLVGGLFLLFIAYGMFRSVKNADLGSMSTFRSPVASGVILSATSPYFLIWWATVGASLIIASEEFGLIGFVALVAFHWTCDLVWFYFLSALSFRSAKFFGDKFQRVVFAVCGVFLILMGGMFIIDGAKIMTWL
ncbi:MAG: LysE family translocator [candidate division Zixibacteria bacterium]|nr:LysE family translocator [candidate division Zixibacteria bacterium]MBU1469149.1 LysE family translocator [candidate division Zixibacteria bacterium]MBU2625972.1 LysE family translocator [candidate division Zixibacteria bacterium]